MAAAVAAYENTTRSRSTFNKVIEDLPRWEAELLENHSRTTASIWQFAASCH